MCGECVECSNITHIYIICDQQYDLYLHRYNFQNVSRRYARNVDTQCQVNVETKTNEQKQERSKKISIYIQNSKIEEAEATAMTATSLRVELCLMSRYFTIQIFARFCWEIESGIFVRQNKKTGNAAFDRGFVNMFEYVLVSICCVCRQQFSGA